MSWGLCYIHKYGTAREVEGFESKIIAGHVRALLSLYPNPSITCSRGGLSQQTPRSLEKGKGGRPVHMLQRVYWRA